MRKISRAGALVILSAALSACAVQQPAPEKTGGDFGVLVMAHGGSQQWNSDVLAAVAPLAKQQPIEVAFGMADAASLQAGVSKLEAHGARKIAVVRLFVSGESFKDRTEQILGITPGAPPAPEPRSKGHRRHDRSRHDQDHGHSMELWKVRAQSSFALSQQGLIEAPEMGEVLAQRAATLSREPQKEDVLILAHGPGDDGENERWIANLNARADAVRGAASFRRVQVETLREDWPEKRKEAEQRIRAFVQQARDEGGTAIVIPFRVQGFGPYAEVLKGLDYASDGTGLIPHPSVTRWIEHQIEAVRLTAFNGQS